MACSLCLYLHTEDRDYTFTSQNVSFINSIRTQCLDVIISGSVGVVTNDLSFSLELSNADISVLGGSAEFNVTSTQIIIQDMDSKSNIYVSMYSGTPISGSKMLSVI